jgi:hypothetical protein
MAAPNTTPNSPDLSTSTAALTPGFVADADLLSCRNPAALEESVIHKPTGEVLAESLVFKSCERKKCVYCGPKRWRRHVAHYTRIFKQRLSEVWLITLTIDPKADYEGRPRSEQRRHLNKDVRTPFLRALRRHANDAGSTLEYTLFVENVPSAPPHIHGVIALPIAVHELCDLWFEHRGGTTCYAERVDSVEKLAGWIKYSTKYLFQTPERKPITEGRAIYASQGIGYNSKVQKELRQQKAIEQASGTASPAIPDDLDVELRRILAPKKSPIAVEDADQSYALPWTSRRKTKSFIFRNSDGKETRWDFQLLDGA